MAENSEFRLSLFLSRAGVASRRQADELISGGHVTVNGQVETSPGRKVALGQDHVKVKGKLITKLAPPVYLVLHKPTGCVTTRSDPQKRRTVFDYLQRVKTPVESVGRLDYDSEGLLLFTNDGDLAYKLSRPEFKVLKVYRAKIKGHPTREELELLRGGIELDGKKTKPAKIGKIKRKDAYTWLEISISEGKYRQVRRMFQRIGHPVVRLRRERYGPLAIEDLAPGRFRYLEQNEIDRLREVVK